MFYIICYVHDCLMDMKILQFTLECAFYLYPGQCYIFLTKCDLCVCSIVLAVSAGIIYNNFYIFILIYARPISWNTYYLYFAIAQKLCTVLRSIHSLPVVWLRKE